MLPELATIVSVPPVPGQSLHFAKSEPCSPRREARVVKKHRHRSAESASMFDCFPAVELRAT